MGGANMDEIIIPLTRGYNTVINNEDRDLADLKWRAHVDKECNSVYVVREVVDETKISRRSTMRLHRVIMERKLGRHLQQNEFVDHINLNGLDNRRENLRLATKGQNMTNTLHRKDNTSGYKGVTFHKASGLWHTMIHHNKKKISLGYYKTAEEAGEAYAIKAKELFGEFARP
jgi:HNH endonuclease